MKPSQTIIGVLREPIEVDPYHDQVVFNVETSYYHKNHKTVIVRGTLGKAMAHRLKQGQMLNIEGESRGNAIVAHWIQLI